MAWRGSGSTGVFLSALVLAGCAQGHEGPRTGRSDGGFVRVDGGGSSDAGGCAPGLASCGGACVDTSTSPLHCGGCGVVCVGGELCNAGSCEATCGPGLEACGGGCTDTSSDAANCGACGAACAPGELCMAGACATSCPGGLSECGGACRDLSSDRSNCGACGVMCGPGEICTAGTCALSCPSGQTPCAGACVDLASDEAHCGACGVACAAGELCSAGTCAPVCGAGLTNCGGTCADTSSDESNCGACAVVCGSGQVCTSGACMTMVIPPETHPFPMAGDVRVGAGSGVYFWRLGDYVEGSRGTGLSTIDQLDVHLVIDPNVLTCDTQDVAVKINGISVGSFSIAGGTTTIDRTYTFAAIAGPTYVVRYETTRTVASGCGSAGYPDGMGSTVTFHAP